MIYKGTKKLLFIWMIIFVLMTSFLVFVFLNLQKSKVSTEILEQEIVQEKTSLQAFESLLKTAENIKEDSEKANSYFIKRDEVVNFLDSIESLGSTTNTLISVQTVKDKVVSSSTAMLSVGLNAKGSYSNLYYLIRLLEELPYQTEIQNIKLVKGASTDKNLGSWVADINIVGIMY